MKNYIGLVLLICCLTQHSFIKTSEGKQDISVQQTFLFANLPMALQVNIIEEVLNANTLYDVFEKLNSLKALALTHKYFAQLMSDSVFTEHIVQRLLKLPGTIKQKKLLGKFGVADKEWFISHINSAIYYDEQFGRSFIARIEQELEDNKNDAYSLAHVEKQIVKNYQLIVARYGVLLNLQDKYDYSTLLTRTSELMLKESVKRQLIRDLVSAGADIDIKTGDFSNTVLVDAVISGKLEFAQFLINLGANINIKSPKGNSPLLKCFLFFSHPHAGVKFLVQSGADVNQTNNRGETPLMLAASESYPKVEEITQFLLQANSDITLCNNNGRTALDLAKYYELHKVVEILEGYNNILTEVKHRPTQKLLCDAVNLGYMHIVKLALQNMPIDIEQELMLVALAKQKYEETQIRAYQIIGRLLRDRLDLVSVHGRLAKNVMSDFFPAEILEKIARYR